MGKQGTHSLQQVTGGHPVQPSIQLRLLTTLQPHARSLAEEAENRLQQHPATLLQWTSIHAEPYLCDVHDSYGCGWLRCLRAGKDGLQMGSHSLDIGLLPDMMPS